MHVCRKGFKWKPTLSSTYNLALGQSLWKLTEFSRHPKLLLLLIFPPRLTLNSWRQESFPKKCSNWSHSSCEVMSCKLTSTTSRVDVNRRIPRQAPVISSLQCNPPFNKEDHRLENHNITSIIYWEFYFIPWWWGSLDSESSLTKKVETSNNTQCHCGWWSKDGGPLTSGLTCRSS